MERLTYSDGEIVHPVDHKASWGKCNVCKISDGKDCGDCAYGKILDALAAYEDLGTPEELAALIKENEALTAERDAAVDDLYRVGSCDHCKYNEPTDDEYYNCTAEKCEWTYRGVTP